jgi:CHAT domain-containing protein/Tfp pilus assembly protein PilF
MLIAAPATVWSAPADDSLAALIRQADAALQGDDCTAAIALYTQVLERAPDLQPAHYRRASCREKLGDLPAAAADYESLIGRFPADAEALGNLGWVLTELGRFTEAREITARAQHLAPLVPAWSTNLADVYLALGDLQAAERWYRAALQLIPDEQQFARGPIADLDLFERHGWAAADAPAMRTWLTAQYPGFQRYRDAWSGLQQSIELHDRQDPRAAAEAEAASKRLATLFGANHPALAAVSNELGSLYVDLNDYAHAKTWLLRALAIDRRVLGDEHPFTAVSLNKLGILYDRTGNFAEAEKTLRHALAVAGATAGRESPAVATSLNHLALVYQHTGAYALAESLDQQALAIDQATLGPEHPDTAVSLSNLASVYDDLGSYSKAEQIYLQELALSERIFGAQDLHTAVSMNNLAHLYSRMGAYEQAEPLYERALAIQTTQMVPEAPDTATGLNNLAQLYDAMGAYDKAEPLFQRALAISEKSHPPDAERLAAVLGNLASLYENTGSFAKAEPLYQRALSLHEGLFGAGRPGTELSLNNLAHLYVAMGDYARAGPLYRRALSICMHTADPQVRARVQSNLADLYGAEHQPLLAIFWGKQAVNTLQALRSGMQTLDAAMSDAFLRFNSRTYAHLADRLIEAGRLPEAQQVLALQKHREYTDFVRGEDGAGPISRLSMTGDEAAWQARAQGAALQADYESYQEALEEIQIAAESMVAEHRALVQSRNLNTSRVDLLSELNAKAGGGVVLLQYVVLEDGLRILMTTAEAQKSFRVAVGEKEINRAVQELLSALRNPHLDPRPAAERLYAVLIEPVAVDLEQTKTRTLMLSLDGTLRYLPFAALYDGHRYLVERYATTIFNEAAPERLIHERRPNWQAAGLGLTLGHEGGFPPLPGVRLELESIVRQRGQTHGILDGVIYLDSAFTEQSLGDALSAGYPVLHVASHFHFSPAGGEGDSFLLLGDGTELTLADLRHRFRLSKVDLLALSACETAVGSGWGRTQNGREVEGMATEAQNLGAMSVLASLWPVADQSTALIMEAFYAGHEHSGLSKADALRQAQRSMMQASAAASESERGAFRIPSQHADSAEVPAFVADAAHPFAHPYYWAPFVLMGNWL